MWEDTVEGAKTVESEETVPVLVETHGLCGAVDGPYSIALRIDDDAIGPKWGTVTDAV